MILHSSFDINSKGRLTIGGCDSIELAEEFGTPLYVLDEGKIRENCREFKSAVEKHLGGGQVLYAAKALSFKGIYNIIKEEGLGADAASLGEMFTAREAGFPLEKIYYHGNNKTDSDIKMAIEWGVGVIVADNHEEVDAISRISGKLGVTQKILLRIIPGIDPHTHKKVITGAEDSKFGVSISSGAALGLTKHILSLPNIDLLGFHCHIGSQIFETQPFVDTCGNMTGFIAEVKSAVGYETRMLNLGGGYGVKYTEEDADVSCGEYMAAMKDALEVSLSEHNINHPELVVETGRYIVASAGATFYTVGSRKTLPGGKTYVSVDGGMTDNPRYTLYGSKYTMLIANKAADKKTTSVSVAGRCCESGDLLGEDIKLQQAERGDILAVLVTGAYNYSLASNYNRFPRPAVVMVRDKRPYIAVRRETFEDLIRCDV